MVVVKNRASGQVVLARAQWCDSFWRRLRGLTFRRSLPDDEGLILVEHAESSLATSIHMLFVFFPIAAIWLDNQFNVVDKTLARPFRLYYASRRPARYVLEGPPALLEQVNVGDQLEITDKSTQ